MNEFYSRQEFIYRERWITPLLRTAVSEHQVVVLTGARQVGKSTLAEFMPDPFIVSSGQGIFPCRYFALMIA